jgi:hypothetical protein
VQYRPDVLVSDQAGTTVAIVEVKALSEANEQNASRYLRNLLAHGIVPHARFVLLITPEMGYLWEAPEALLRGTAPSLIFPMERITQHYLRTNGRAAPPEDLVLEAIVKQWLSDLADGIAIDEAVTKLLREAGFLDAVRDGLVSAPALA